jgi:hypothetical protein
LFLFAIRRVTNTFRGNCETFPFLVVRGTYYFCAVYVIPPSVETIGSSLKTHCVKRVAEAATQGPTQCHYLTRLRARFDVRSGGRVTGRGN